MEKKGFDSLIDIAEHGLFCSAVNTASSAKL